MKTPYDVLGIAPDADEKAIASAFRDAAKACHPDLHPENRAAERQFKRITAARDALKNPEWRALYRYLQLRRLHDRRHWMITIASCAVSALVSAGVVGLLQQQSESEPVFEDSLLHAAVNDSSDIGRQQQAYAFAGIEADAARGRDAEPAATASSEEMHAGPREDRDAIRDQHQDLAAFSMAPAPAHSTLEVALPQAIQEADGGSPASKRRAAKTCHGIENRAGKSRQPAGGRCAGPPSGMQPHRESKTRPRIPTAAAAKSGLSHRPSSLVGRAASSPPRGTPSKQTSIQTPPAADSSRPSYAPSNECWVDGGGGGWIPCGTGGQ